ncbi:hypothetical protein O0L34_g3519 [Tuta absoluta]|nr:hypothetical protein O0L34_g3519 [Tuta absoluta]
MRIKVSETETPTSPPPLSHQSSQEESAPKPDFKINQPVTTCHVTDHIPKEPSSLPTATSNRVSTLIHNYNLYGNVKEPQPIYGNTEVTSIQSSSSIDEVKIDDAPMASVKSRVQAFSGKVDSPPIYAVSKKSISLDQTATTDQG